MILKTIYNKKIKENEQENSSKETRLSKALRKISTSRTAKEVAKDMVNKTRKRCLLEV